MRSKREVIKMVKVPRRQVEGSSVFSLLAVFKAVLWAVVIYVILAFLTTVVISVRSEVETKLPTLAQAAQYLGVLIAGLVAGRRVNRSGWLHGLGAGLAFMAIISVMGSLFFSPSVGASGIIVWQLLPAIVLGLCGGILGANL
jgi:putative membrane protein (TIGR04086 family)